LAVTTRVDPVNKFKDGLKHEKTHVPKQLNKLQAGFAGSQGLEPNFTKMRCAQSATFKSIAHDACGALIDPGDDATASTACPRGQAQRMLGR
jgi:hypothetical protein